MRSLRIYIRQLRKIGNRPFSLIGIFLNFFRWKNFLGVKSLDAGLPWMTFDAIELLDNYVKDHMHVFEYGSGGSSIFFARKAREVISVEHDSEWMNVVENKIKSTGLKSWVGKLILPEKNNIINPASAEEANDYISSDESYVGYNFKKYATAIDDYPDGYFDLVIVDGRARPSCIMHSIPKIKEGGWLVVDNTGRPSYHPAMQKYIFGSFDKVVETCGPTTYIANFTMTSIWRKKEVA